MIDYSLDKYRIQFIVVPDGYTMPSAFSCSEFVRHLFSQLNVVYSLCKENVSFGNSFYDLHAGRMWTLKWSISFRILKHWVRHLNNAHCQSFSLSFKIQHNHLLFLKMFFDILSHSGWVRKLMVCHLKSLMWLRCCLILLYVPSTCCSAWYMDILNSCLQSDWCDLFWPMYRMSWFFFSDDKDDTDYFSFELLLVWETNFLCGSLILRRVDPKARGDCGEICNNLWMCVRPTPI